MIGSRVPALPALIALGLCVGAAVQAAPRRKNAGRDKTESYALVAGTVFRDPGFALAGAKVELWVRGGKKIQESITSPRGEFTFRVPPREADYVVRASMKGYRPEEKEASISGQDRIDVNLVLSPEPPK